MDAREVVAALGGRWHGGGRGVARCPAHADRTPSLAVRDAPDGRLLFHCYAGCEQRAVADALSAFGLFGRRDGEWRPPDPAVIARRERQEAELVAKLRASARGIWRRAAPIPGTPAELYLRTRGIGLALPPSLRFAILRHTPSGQRLPAMIAAVQEPDGAIVAVHRTYLSADGRKAAVDPVRMMLGRAEGGAVRLTPAGPTLCVAEGIEDALSVQQETGLPCWAALSAGNLDGLTLPEAVGTVIVCADNDPAGEAGARAAARAYLAAGREVRITRPPAPHKDFNDLLRAACSARRAA